MAIDAERNLLFLFLVLLILLILGWICLALVGCKGVLKVSAFLDLAKLLAKVLYQLIDIYIERSVVKACIIEFIILIVYKPRILLLNIGEEIPNGSISINIRNP